MYLLRYIINICIFLPLILALFLLVTKLSAKQYINMNKRKYMQVLEKSMISKDIYSLVIRTGDTVYSGILTPNGFNMIKELNALEISELNNNIDKVTTLNNVNKNTYSFDMIKSYIQIGTKKITDLLNKISKERN